MQEGKHGGRTSVSSAAQDEHAVADADQGDREDRLSRARVARRAVTLLLPFPLNVEARHLDKKRQLFSQSCPKLAGIRENSRQFA